MGKKARVILQAIKFRQQAHLAIITNEKKLDDVIRNFEDAEWSTGYKFWHIPLSKSNFNNVVETLKPYASVDTSAFHKFKFPDETNSTSKRKRVKVPEVKNDMLTKIDQFYELQPNKQFSAATGKLYRCMLSIFFGWYNNKTDNEITNNDIQLFLKAYFEANQFSPTYKRLMVTALRHYFSEIGRTDIKI
ncbi:MAG TPA: hypothetical protein PLF35_03250 [Prolixibacteraceae bacterium]|nr:hypothetical protein [Prolixibacteraceae bacterium]